MPSLATTPVEIVTNPKTQTDSLTQASLRAIFSMRLRQWPDGTPVTVYVLPDRNETHVAFSKQVLHTYPYVLRDNWDRMVFTGTGRAPIELKSEEELVRRVAATPGGIGYIGRGNRSNHALKTLQVR